ncbi:hypothetical protein INT47_000746 [Mucor saturninus]|uniref:DDE-1 domain-containing protein n=1 Tax=Mucor saturninus TaxID=64648 RepID=A0A8H7UX03_9FUNG|nr:hypothetical protein INT47_000746 [Mucor saturninus]
MGIAFGREGRKVILLLDNASVHKLKFKQVNIKLVFLPANTTSMLQALNAGIVANFKAYVHSQQCKYIADSYRPPLEVIFTSDEGNLRPFLIAKQVAARNPFTCHRYVDTPPPSPRIINTVMTNDETINIGSDSSSVSSEKSASFSDIKLTKHCVIDFFNCISSIDKPVNRDLYTFGHWNTGELFNFVKTSLRDIVDVYTPAQVADWLSKDGRFGHSQVVRLGSKRESRRSLSIFKEEHWGEYINYGACH